MSEKAPQANNSINLDVETILLTAEGRPFIKQINSVSRVLSMKHSEVKFRGEQLVKTGYVGDCKSVQLFKCPNGYFLFCNKAFSNNNWSIAGDTLKDVFAALTDTEIKTALKAVVSEEAT